MGGNTRRDGVTCLSWPSNVSSTSIEISEHIAPLRFHHKKLRPDSGGAGRHRGGLGQEILIESRSDTPIAVSFLAERTLFPAFGIEGGKDGAPGELRINGKKTDPEEAVRREQGRHGLARHAGRRRPWRSAPARSCGARGRHRVGLRHRRGGLPQLTPGFRKLMALLPTCAITCAQPAATGKRTARDGCHRRYSLNLSDNFASMARHLQSVPACSHATTSRCECAFRGRRCYSEEGGHVSCCVEIFSPRRCCWLPRRPSRNGCPSSRSRSWSATRRAAPPISPRGLRPTPSSASTAIPSSSTTRPVPAAS